MLLKKRYLFLILIVCFFAISAVSAEEIGNNTNILVSGDDSGLMAESVNEDLLTDSYGTFKELQDEIGVVGEGGTLNLTRSYKYVGGSTDGIQINKAITIDGKGHTLDGNQLSTIFDIYSSNVILKNLTIINSKTNNMDDGAIYWCSDNGFIVNCNFDNNYALYGSAIHAIGNHINIVSCNFTNNYAEGAGTVYYLGDYNNVSQCYFLNNFAKDSGGALFTGFNGYNKYGFVTNCTFINNSVACAGGAMDIYGSYNGYTSDCIFINNSASAILGSAYGGAIIFQSSENYTIKNCIFYENYASSYADVMYLVSDMEVNIFNCSFINHESQHSSILCDSSSLNVYNLSFNYLDDYSISKGAYAIINYIKQDTNIFCNNNISFNYKNASDLTVSLNNSFNYLSNKKVIFNLYNGQMFKTFYSITNSNGVINLCSELNVLGVGVWSMVATFEGNDKYNPCNTTATITVLPPSTSLTIGDSNGTVGHETTLIANVISNLTINEGTVTFFDGKTNIGKANVVDGKASITYTPTTAGEHTITAIFNSDNYLSSNDTSRLLVDSATVDVLVDSGVVGFNSNFVANVKGLYSTVNEGNVKFYVGKEYLGKVPVVNGSASTNYVPLIAGDYTVNVIYCDSDKFLDDEDSTGYHVSKADTKTLVNDLNGTVGHGVSITSIVSSSNKLTVNEGSVVFFDGKNQIGESQVTNGKASITYTPTTAGEHTITAIFNSDNYLSSNDTSVLSVKKANIDLSIADIAPVLFTNPSNFAVNVNSNYKPVNEGKIKYYVNNDLVGTVNVNDGVANLDYVTNTAGSFTLVAVYDETSNYLASNATATFIVNKMPTVLSAESVIFDEKGDKTFTTDLKDDNSIGVSGQNVKIETIKYSGESKTFNGITNIDGIAEYNVKNLEGGMWFVTGTYDGNGNYINSKFSDKFIVIRMDTTTNIEGIDNPQVNHTYKLKANIHDENGKLVKEGIVQFYLDGVDIGSIDLSKHELKSNNDLLGASNPIFDYNLGEDEEPYLEYTPTKAGTYTLSAVYEGTTIYRTSNETTTLIVKEEDSFILSAPDVTKYYGGSERFIVTLTDLSGNPIKNAVVKITINGRTSEKVTDDNGITSMGINLNSGVYITTTEYNGTKVNSTVTVKDTVIAKDFSKIFRNGTQYQGTFVDSQGNLIRNTDIEININGVFYTRKTNDNGVAQMNINLPPGTYILTATNPLSKEQHTTKVTVLPNIVENHDLTKYYKNASQYSLRLLDDKGNPVGAGVSIQLNINGVFYTRTSDANGYVKMNINLPPGTYIITAEYKGLRASNTIKVLSVLETHNLVMKYKDGSKFEAKILDGQGRPYAGQTVTFNINGVFYTKTTEADGIARLKINLLAGEYIITSMYNGLNAANKVTISG